MASFDRECPSLHGRETELALIDGLLDQIDQGGSALVCSGAPGIGKSAPLEEAKSRPRERGIIVLGLTGVLVYLRSIRRKPDSSGHYALLRSGSPPKNSPGVRIPRPQIHGMDFRFDG
jgi:hypothetical protein